MVNHKPVERVEFPISRVYWTLVKDLKPGRHVSIRDIQGLAARRERKYEPSVKLTPNSMLVTDNNQSQLEAALGADRPILVGDLREGQGHRQVMGTKLNAILDHMHGRREILERHSIIMNEEGEYPYVLDTPGLVHPNQFSSKRSSLVHREMQVILAVDASDPRAFGPMLKYAKAVEAELRFEAEYFCQQDKEIKVVVFDSTANHFTSTRDYLTGIQTRRFSAGRTERRKTSKGLEECIKLALNGNGKSKLGPQRPAGYTARQAHNKYGYRPSSPQSAQSPNVHTHIYLLTSGPPHQTDFNDTNSLCGQIKTNQHITASVFVATHDGQEPNIVEKGQLLYLAEDSGADLHILKVPELISPSVVQHFERYRMGRAN